jgi:hypothetical protein
MDLGWARELAAALASSSARIGAQAHSALRIKAPGLKPLMNRVLKAASDHTPVARIDVMTRPSMNPPADSSMHAESAEAVATHISPVTEDTATAMPGKWTAHSLQTFA